MSEPLEFSAFVAMEPAAKARPRMTRQGHTYTPSGTMKAEARIQQQVSEAYGRLPYDGPLQVSITVWLQKPKSKPKTRPCRPTGRPDVDNYAKLVLDALNGILWRDDSLVCRLFTEKVYCNELHPHPGFQIAAHSMDLQEVG